MFKRAKDYYFIFSMLFMTIMGVYFVYQQAQNNRLNNYLSLLYEKISELAADEKSQAVLEKYFADFIEGIKDGNVSDEDIKGVADSIIDIKLSKNKLGAEDIIKILPPVKIEKKPSLIASISNTIKIKSNANWDSLSTCFIKSLAVSDSIFKVMIKNKRLQRMIEKKLTVHEKLSQKYRSDLNQARESFEKIKEKIGNTAHTLSKMDEEKLKAEIEKLREQNSIIHNKINSLEQIEKQLKQYRIKLEAEIARLDSENNI